MPNRNADPLYLLVHSLEQAEKRNFKLFVKRSSHNEDLKIIELFDAIDKLPEYDETKLLKKLPSIQKPQLSNIKVHLYKQLLASLRLLKSTDSIDLQLTEQFDYAHILYKKGLFAQGLKILDKVKETAKANQKFNFLTHVIALEKRIETLHISRSMQSRAEVLSAEALEVSDRIAMMTKLSNLAMLLYSWFIKHGHARKTADDQAVKDFFTKNLPENAFEQTGFYERLYLYQSFTWYAYIRQDFLTYYRYAQKWVDIFDQDPIMIRVETSHYIKGLHNLLNAHFDLKNYKKFQETLEKFQEFSETPRVQQHENFRVHSFVYINSAKLNQHSLIGTFNDGLKLVPYIEEKLKEYGQYLDEHRIMVINYKIATIYFGSGDFSTCIDYLQKIINDNYNIRNDLQCYARLLHLIAHYELGNFVLMEYLTKSVYRFMAKKENLSQIDEELFKFLRISFHLSRNKLMPELEKLLEKIKHLEKNRFETRAFAYIDIISWIESKLEKRPMSRIIQDKFLASKRAYEIKN
ncbi:MAG: hypothetical protein NVS3B19_18870 [Ginsengibacter sp.]